MKTETKIAKPKSMGRPVDVSKLKEKFNVMEKRMAKFEKQFNKLEKLVGKENVKKSKQVKSKKTNAA